MFAGQKGERRQPAAEQVETPPTRRKRPTHATQVHNPSPLFHSSGEAKSGLKESVSGSEKANLRELGEGSKGSKHQTFCVCLRKETVKGKYLFDDRERGRHADRQAGGFRTGHEANIKAKANFPNLQVASREIEDTCRQVISQRQTLPSSPYRIVSRAIVPTAEKSEIRSEHFVFDPWLAGPHIRLVIDSVTCLCGDTTRMPLPVSPKLLTMTGENPHRKRHGAGSSWLRRDFSQEHRWGQRVTCNRSCDVNGKLTNSSNEGIGCVSTTLVTDHVPASGYA